jgi:NH3-dependent NAD+ synthetase
MSELNYEHVFNVLVDKTAEYVTSNNLKVMVLGISGGIDSTVVAAICHEVSKKTGIPLIGRSLPIKNKSDEFATSVHVGEAFCNEFSVYRLERSYRAALFDACADAGDFDPIQDLWKTEVYELAKWISNRYKNIEHHHTIMTGAGSKSDAIELSIALTPTDGLGISNSDLEQIGAKSYDEVDDILSRYIPFKEYRQKHGEPLHPHDEMAESDCWSQLCVRHGEDVVNKVWSRHLASEFKRKKAPIYISRELYE